MADDTYELIRNLTDNSGRPLINSDADGETLFGKKVLISPSIASSTTSSLYTGGKIIFGNLDHLIVRLSDVSMSKTLETSDSSYHGEISRGEYLLIGRLRADSVEA